MAHHLLNIKDKRKKEVANNEDTKCKKGSSGPIEHTDHWRWRSSGSQLPVHWAAGADSSTNCYNGSMWLLEDVQAEYGHSTIWPAPA